MKTVVFIGASIMTHISHALMNALWALNISTEILAVSGATYYSTQIREKLVAFKNTHPEGVLYFFVLLQSNFNWCYQRTIEKVGRPPVRVIHMHKKHRPELESCVLAFKDLCEFIQMTFTNNRIQIIHLPPLPRLYQNQCCERGFRFENMFQEIVHSEKLLAAFASKHDYVQVVRHAALLLAYFTRNEEQREQFVDKAYLTSWKRFKNALKQIKNQENMYFRNPNGNLFAKDETHLSDQGAAFVTSLYVAAVLQYAR